VRGASLGSTGGATNGVGDGVRCGTVGVGAKVDVGVVGVCGATLATAGEGARGVTGMETRNEPPEGEGVTGALGGGEGLTAGVAGVLTLGVTGVLTLGVTGVLTLGVTGVLTLAVLGVTGGWVFIFAGAGLTGGDLTSSSSFFRFFFCFLFLSVSFLGNGLYGSLGRGSNLNEANLSPPNLT
jgi:hypothetical protein